MAQRKKVSIAVIKRLPRYYRYLSDLLKMDITRISSKELSKRMGITASQIRQDLNCFGGFGQQGYGYNVELLFNEIAKILGADKMFTAIIIGAGNMGQALAHYKNFEKRGFRIIGVFDNDPRIIGKKMNGIEVLDIKKLEDFVSSNHVDIAMLTVPYEATRDIAEELRVWAYADFGISRRWT